MSGGTAAKPTHMAPALTWLLGINRLSRIRDPSTKGRLMPKHFMLAIPHDLSVAEVRRRLDQRLGPVLRQLEKRNVRVATTDWFEGSRTFTASVLGQNLSGNLCVAADSLWLEGTLPWSIGAFAPLIRALATHYVAHLLTSEGGVSDEVARFDGRPGSAMPDC